MASPEPGACSRFVPMRAVRTSPRDAIMLKWAIIFLVISLVAGALGFTGIAVGAARISKILFAIFLAIFVILLVLALLAGEALL